MSGLRQGTYSIVARDPETGQLGVAVQSHWFSVGSVVTWARAGVGAVATQANAKISYGPRALDLMGEGLSAQDALARLLAEDAGSASRQVAVIDAGGTPATHTGAECIPFAGHISGAGVSCQANIMADAAVWPAMLDSFESSRGTLAERMLSALQAAEQAGGDLRGRQSAAMLIVPAAGEPWEADLELRVEDHPDPLGELQRLMALHGAYAVASRADDLVGEGQLQEASELYQRASELAPENHELLFWAGLGAAESGDLETGAAHVRAAIAMHPGWAELLPRLPAEVAPAAVPLLRFMAGQR